MECVATTFDDRMSVPYALLVDDGHGRRWRTRLVFLLFGIPGSGRLSYRCMDRIEALSVWHGWC